MLLERVRVSLWWITDQQSKPGLVCVTGGSPVRGTGALHRQTSREGDLHELQAFVSIVFDDGQQGLCLSWSLALLGVPAPQSRSLETGSRGEANIRVRL